MCRPALCDRAVAETLHFVSIIRIKRAAQNPFSIRKILFGHLNLLQERPLSPLQFRFLFLCGKKPVSLDGSSNMLSVLLYCLFPMVLNMDILWPLLL